MCDDRMSLAEEREMLARHAAGDAAATARIVASCERFITSAAYRYGGAHTDDLMQQGREGILNALRTFRPDAGVRFLTYAGRAVQSEMRDWWVEHRRIVRTPNGGRTRAVLSRITSNTGAPESDYRGEAIRGMLTAADESIDDVQCAASGDSPEEIAARHEEWRRIETMLWRLSLRERDILARRFRDEQTHRECAEAHGVSAVRVQQIERRAIEKMRAWMADREAA